MIENKPRINMDPKDAKLKELQDEISRLKAELEGSDAPGTLSGSQEERIRRIEEKVVTKERGISKEILESVRIQAENKKR